MTFRVATVPEVVIWAMLALLVPPPWGTWRRNRRTFAGGRVVVPKVSRTCPAAPLPPERPRPPPPGPGEGVDPEVVAEGLEPPLPPLPPGPPPATAAPAAAPASPPGTPPVIPAAEVPPELPPPDPPAPPPLLVPPRPGCAVTVTESPLNVDAAPLTPLPAANPPPPPGPPAPTATVYVFPGVTARAGSAAYSPPPPPEASNPLAPPPPPPQHSAWTDVTPPGQVHW